MRTGLFEESDQRGDELGVNDVIDLRLGPRGDVRDGPAGFLANSLLGARQKGQETWKSIVVDDELGLEIVTSYNVSNGSQCWSLDSW